MQLNPLMHPVREEYIGYMYWRKMLCEELGEEGKDEEDPIGEYLLYQGKKNKAKKTFP